MLHKSMSPKKIHCGFTLLEILIALFIFTIISIIMTGALHTAITSQSATTQKAARLAKLQIALLMMSRDIEQTINRPTTNAQGQVEGFIGATDAVTFTHAGLTNPFGKLQRSTLQRTRYQLEENKLMRVTWPALDSTAETPLDKRQLLPDVEALHFEYLDSHGHFQKIWPPLDQPKAPMPHAVRVFLTLKNWGKINQLYIIPGQPLDKPH